MPNVNVYLSEGEYARLVFLASKQGLRASQLARKILREQLEKGEKHD